MVPPPTGVVTLVFTDIEGSSELNKKFGDAFGAVRGAHFQILAQAALTRAGYLVETAGDSLFVVFPRVSDAVEFAIDAQRRLAARPWGELLPGIEDLRVRIGIHTGQASPSQLTGEMAGKWNYFGTHTDRASRVCAAGHGRQVLVSEATRALSVAELHPGIGFRTLGRFRLKGVGEETLWQVTADGLWDDFPPPDPPPTEKFRGLPVTLTPFIGRVQEALAVREKLLAPGAHLVTLTGPGGMGKTRLAGDVAEDIAMSFEDGVVFVGLENVTTCERMRGRIALALDLPLDDARPAEDQILAYLAARRFLIVLDNLEQMHEPGQKRSRAAPDLNRLFAATDSRFLATSRIALGLPAEIEHPVRSLDPSDATQLFLERWRTKGHPELEDSADLEDVRQFCSHVSGLPLAIVLAASTRGLAPHTILKKFGNLTGVTDVIDETIRRSYDLLPSELAELFAQVAVLEGSFAMEDAEAICTSGDVFNGILELVNQSLLEEKVVPGSRDYHYEMLQPIRVFGLDMLAMSEAAASIRRRHARHFAAMAEREVARLRGPDEADALRVISAQLRNLRAGLQWAVGAREAELAARIAVAAWPALHRRGFWDLARDALDGALSTLDTHPSDLPDQRASLSLALASLYDDLGQPAKADALAVVALSLRESIGNALGIAEALNIVGLLALKRGDYEAAEAELERALPLVPGEDSVMRGVILHNLARTGQRMADVEKAATPERARERLDLARHRYEEALSLYRRQKYARGEAETLNNLGVIAADHDGDISQGRRHYQRALAIYRDLESPFGIALALYNLGDVAEKAKDDDRAIALIAHSARVWKEIGAAEAAEAEQHLDRIRARLGDGRFEELRANGMAAIWENLVL